MAGERLSDADVDGLLWHGCSCGNAKVIDGSKLTRGKTVSCGCFMREKQKQVRPVTKHGHSPQGAPSATYRSWYAMLARCENPKSSSFKTHGARGITVCERWHDFKLFLEDVGERPQGTTLDRFPDGAGNYEPGNVRWATPAEQRRNSSRTTIGFDKAVRVALDLLSGARPTDIARTHGVTRGAVYAIKSGEGWVDAMEHARCIATHDKERP